MVVAILGWLAVILVACWLVLKLMGRPRNEDHEERESHGQFRK
jgi:flagellar biogenesis protein FliO